MALIIRIAVLKQMRAMLKADQARIVEAPEQIAADLTVRIPFVTEMVGEPGGMAAAERRLAGDVRY